MYTYKIKVNDNFVSLPNDKVEWFGEQVKFGRSDSHSVISSYVEDVNFISITRTVLIQLGIDMGFTDKVKLYVYKENEETKIPELWKSYIFDFSTIEDDGDKLSISLVDDSIRAKVESSSDVDYEIELGADSDVLMYTGVKRLAVNRMQALAGKLSEMDVTEWYEDMDLYAINGNRTNRSYTNNWAFKSEGGSPYDSVRMRCLVAGTYTIRVKIEDLSISMESFQSAPESGHLGLYRKHNTPFSSWETLRVIPTVDRYRNVHYLREKYVYDEYITKDYLVGDEVRLMYWGYDPTLLDFFISAPSVTYSSSQNNYIEISDLSDSGSNGKTLRGLTHKRVCDKLLTKILGSGNYTLDWKASIPFQDIICSSQSLRQITSPVMNTSMSDLFKSLRTWGVSYDIQGNTFIVDNIENFYKDEYKDLKFDVIGNVKYKADSKHVYNQIIVGYETSDNDSANGSYAFCSKNTFTIDNPSLSKDSDGKKLEIISPYIADCYTIEDLLGTFEEDTTTDNSTDNRCFVFAVKKQNIVFNGFEITFYVPYRDYNTSPTTTSDADTVYNVPLSPKRLLLFNHKYISISGIGKDEIKFASGEKNTKMVSQMDYETSDVTENSNESFVSPLFMPYSIEFDSVHNYQNLAMLEAIKHNYFIIFDAKRNRNYKWFIQELNISVGMNQSQTIEGLLKEL